MNAPHPALFIGHGSPMQAIEPTRYTEAWARIGAALPRPRAILAVSAHWYTRGTAVTAQPRPRTIHDFHGFPAALYAMQYPAPGDPQLAARVAQLLAPTAVALDAGWGLDHGSWSVLQ
jgi:4,5-DOPA dioxygenase extradiol